MSWRAWLCPSKRNCGENSEKEESIVWRLRPAQQTGHSRGRNSFLRLYCRVRPGEGQGKLPPMPQLFPAGPVGEAL